MDVINDSANYVAAVIKDEVAKQNVEHLRGSEYREYVEKTDSSRKIRHDTLILSMIVLEKQCDALDIDAPFRCHDRREYGDAAFRIVSEIFASRS